MNINLKRLQSTHETHTPKKPTPKKKTGLGEFFVFTQKRKALSGRYCLSINVEKIQRRNARGSNSAEAFLASLSLVVFYFGSELETLPTALIFGSFHQGKEQERNFKPENKY